jgi:hypothetical protein
MELRDKEQAEKLSRLEDSTLRLRAILELRWSLLSRVVEIKNHDIYIEGNELLNEMEEKVWEFIDGNIDNF